ncbi:Lar family restriction alleviation protein [Neoasaia chiangmaiensis]|uniref:Lar family restriction alleviation protein n=1 Tax=Neoasaia chiangmaiensis TaxID=320497 RepID=UPI001580DAA3|nr:Lar family restriction alleviation protein [Neoasaia chiangmaiensis]
MTNNQTPTRTREGLLPCPFCGGEAERVDIAEGENAGGSCICCTRCLASGNVEFGFKENFVSNWNARARSEAEAARGVEAFAWTTARTIEWFRSHPDRPNVFGEMRKKERAPFSVPLYTRPAPPDDSAEKIARLVKALRAADQFITNGIEFGFIRMPDPETNDSASRTPDLIRAALASASTQGDGE